MSSELFFSLFLIFGFILLIGLRVPITFAMLFTAFLYIIWSGRMPMRLISLTMTSGITNFTILAVPLFMAAGEIMNNSGITKRIFGFANVLVGHLTGGMGQVNVLASLLFSGVSTSAVADAVALGNIQVKAMRQVGYDDDFIVGVSSASSIVGPIYPPSGPMVLFGTLASISIGGMFMAGITVGITMTLFLMITVWLICRKRTYPKRSRAKFPEVFKSFKSAFWALLLAPFMKIALATGTVHATEVGAIAVLYSLFLGIFVYKELRKGMIIGILKRVVEIVGMIMMLISAGQVFASVLVAQRVPDMVGGFLFGMTTNPYLLILIVIVFLLIMGTFMETTAAIMVSIPLMLPVIDMIGMSPVQFGVLLIFVLMISLLTPPMAIILFIMSKIANISFMRSFHAVKIYYIAYIIIALIIGFFPTFTLWLPRLIFGPSMG